MSSVPLLKVWCIIYDWESIVISTVHIELDIGQIFQTGVWFPERICLKEWYLKKFYNCPRSLLPLSSVFLLWGVSYHFLNHVFPSYFLASTLGTWFLYCHSLDTEINGVRVIKPSYIQWIIKDSLILAALQTAFHKVHCWWECKSANMQKSQSVLSQLI